MSRQSLDIAASTSAPLTSTPVSFALGDVDPPNAGGNLLSWTARIWSNVDCHISVTGPATTNDFPLVAGFNGIEVRVPFDGAVSVVKMTSAADGQIWCSRVRYV